MHLPQRLTALLVAVSMTLPTIAIPPAHAEDDHSSEMLKAENYGLPATAHELPSKRTLRTATFDLGSGKRAQVGVDSKLFTHADDGRVVFASDDGVVRDEHFVFERLAQDVRVSFDLREPRYVLTVGGKAIEFAFATDHSVTGTVLDAHSIAYQLTPSARLVWTVEGNTVKKAIHITKDGTKPDLSFILSSPSLTQTLNNNRITFTDPSTQKVVLQTQAPFFTTTNGDPLLVPVTITETASGSFSYSYDEDQLPSDYILDPSAGPNNPANAEIDTSNGGNSWLYDLLDVLSLDGNKVSCQASLAECSRLKLYNFGFAIPDTATIDGVEVNIYGTAPSSESMSVTMMKLLNDSRAPVGTNKATNGAWPGGSDGYDNKTLTLGGTTDTWGVTLTPAIVNDSDFGFVYSQQDLSGMGATAQIDAVNITVYYTEASCDSSAGLCPIGDAVVDLSGTLYSDLGVTAVSNKTVKVAVNGGYITSTTTGLGLPTGQFAFSSVPYDEGDIITLYVDGDANNAVTVFRASASIGNTGVNLYYDYLTLDSRNGSALTNGNLSTATVSGENDITDIYSVSGGNLTMGSSTTLYVPSGKAYTPGGNITTPGSINIAGTFTAGTNTVTLNGSNQTIKGNSGNLTFYNLSKTNGGGSTLTIDGNGGAVIASNSLTLSGTSAESQLTVADVGSTVFRLTSGGSQSLSYLSVANMSAAGGDELACNTSCTDGGTNTNWSFAGGGGGGGDVPEFSTLGLVILLSGCIYVISRRSELETI